MQLPDFPPMPAETLEAITERPAAMLLEVTRFFLGSPGRPWTDLYGVP
jgi:hypothetical protein